MDCYAAHRTAAVIKRAARVKIHLYFIPLFKLSFLNWAMWCEIQITWARNWATNRSRNEILSSSIEANDRARRVEWPTSGPLKRAQWHWFNKKAASEAQTMCVIHFARTEARHTFKIFTFKPVSKCFCEPISYCVSRAAKRHVHQMLQYLDRNQVRKIAKGRIRLSWCPVENISVTEWKWLFHRKSEPGCWLIPFGSTLPHIRLPHSIIAFTSGVDAGPKSPTIRPEILPTLPQPRQKLICPELSQQLKRPFCLLPGFRHDCALIHCLNFRFLTFINDHISRIQ
jgi:hypothetical protein